MMKFNKADTVSGYTACAHIHLIGSGECVVDGLKRVLEYTSEYIKIDLGSFSVGISGCALRINEFSLEGAIIRGDILSLEYFSNK